MIAIRGLAFLFFLLLAVAMMLWQVNHLYLDIVSAWSQTAMITMMGVGGAILLIESLVYRTVGERISLSALCLLALPTLPIVGLFGGVISALQYRGGRHREIWLATLTIGALISVNLLLPLALGVFFIGGGPGLSAGWISIKFQFFLVVDYFLGRAILYYFNSGASPFVSLRYLRRRVMSILAVVGILIGVAVLILVNSVMSGFQTDFREQMRGSLSHLLVRFSAEDIHIRIKKSVRQQAEWAEYVSRIEADDAMLPDWHEALDRALQHYRTSDKDALPDPADFMHAQPPIPPNGESDDGDDPVEPEDGLTEDEREFLRRLRTGEGLSDFDRECLTNEAGVIITPKDFYLSRVGNPKEQAADIHLSWYAPIFREALQEEFDKTALALEKHVNPLGEEDITGVSWRVSTKTFITPKSGSRELPIAELVGVDPEREPTISNVGEYVANAELTEFRDQYVLRPLLNLLGATLGWETDQSLEATDGRPLMIYTEDGKRMSGGRLRGDLTKYLAARRFSTPSGRVRWRSFDTVEFQEFSPGRQIYERVREAYKNASRTEDLNELGRVLEECEKDVQAILTPYLENEGTERFEKVNHTGARVIYQRYLTGFDRAHDAMKIYHRDFVEPIQHYLSDNADSISSAEKELLEDLWNELVAFALATHDQLQDRELTDSEREDILVAVGSKYRNSIETALQKVRKERMPGEELLENLLAFSRNQDNLRPLSQDLELRRVVPLSFAAERFDDSAEAVQERMDAYRKVLPIRTFMKPGEDAEDYFKRARAMPVRDDDYVPGVILGDALADSALGRGVTVGDQVAITIPRIYFEDNRLAPRTTEVWFRVTGMFRSGLYDENAGRMYCDFEELSYILADSETRYIVGAKMKDYSYYEGQVESDKLKTDVGRALDNHRVHYKSVGVWEDETRTLLEAVNIERSLIGLIVSLIIVLAGGAIVIIVYQLVNEKVRDIGILKALGHSPWGIRSVFMFNALFIGLFGAIGGATLGILTSQYLNEIEDFIDEATGIRLFPPEVYFLTYIPSVKGIELIWLAIDIAVPVVMFGFFCGILPSMAAARKDPVEALHYE